MSLLHYLSYVAIFAAFVFVILSLASGLLYISELIEEHSRLARSIGEKGIYTIIVLHVLLYLFDSLPLAQILFSIVCHVVYLQNFSSTWPLISLTSLSFTASCVLVIVNHFLWFFYFSRRSNDARHTRVYRGAPGPAAPGFGEVATFFGLCVWLVPLFLFLSLSANDNALPVSATDPGSPSPVKQQQPPARTSLFRSVMSNFSDVPGIRFKASQRDTTEGILAPRSPKPALSAIPQSPSFGSSVFGTPPRSPVPSTSLNDIDSHLSPSSSFQLSTPPRRSAPVARRQVGDSVGLGLRKPSSTSVNSGE